MDGFRITCLGKGRTAFSGQRVSILSHLTSMGPKRTTKTLKLPDQETFKKYIKTVVNKTKSSLRALCEKKVHKADKRVKSSENVTKQSG